MGPAAASPDKAELRRTLTAARRARSEAEIARLRAELRRHVLRRCRRDGWRRVAGYVPLRTEPGSTELLDGLRAAGVDVLTPVLLADHDLDWAPWSPVRRDGGDVPGTRLGPAAVAATDAVLVPALAVARDGTRLGRGGGSYDRALRRVPAPVPRIALVYDDELLARLPADPWDVPVTEAVTPSGWGRVGRGDGPDAE